MVEHTALDHLLTEFGKRGVRRLFVKELALQDNDKNQIYISKPLDGLANTLRAHVMSGSTSSSTKKRASTPGKPKDVGRLNWTWIGDGPDAAAPGAQLIQ